MSTSEHISEDTVRERFEEWHRQHFTDNEMKQADNFDGSAYKLGMWLAYQAGLSANKWISAKDRLPDQRIRVLAWDGLSVEDCFYGRGTASGAEEWKNPHWRITGSEVICRFPITHWQPLPQKP